MACARDNPAPIIAVDSREQVPLKFEKLKSQVVTLTTGDYSVIGCEQEFSIERKGSLDEVAACCMGDNRLRFERELLRLKAYRFRRLLIVSSEEAILTHQYRSNISPRSVLGSLYAWQARFDVPLVFTATAEGAARLVELWAHYYCRELVEKANALLTKVP